MPKWGHDEVLSGWGRTSPTRGTVVTPDVTPDVEAALRSDGSPDALDGTRPRGLIARGLGRSYGDAAQVAGGTVVDMTAIQDTRWENRDAGLLRVGAGVTLEALMSRYLPRGWFVPVTPGTRLVTVGGAIASDIHGKNHHRDGSFCQHLTELVLATPTGTVTVGPEQDPELYWATAGGMGLTGVVTEATIRMLPVETSWMLVDTERTSDLDATMAALESTDGSYRYSVAWLDCQARGRHMGRGVLTSGDHARLDDLPAKLVPRATAFSPDARLRVPTTAPRGLLNPLSIAAFNELWFRKAPRHQVGHPESIASFFHPLDIVTDWNLLYGPSGFLQYQFAVGPDHADVVRSAVELLSGARVASFLAVLKRFGPADPGPLSFPTEGWTLALDLPIGPPGLAAVLDTLDELVADAGGRVYLAKDSRLRPDLLRRMYPRLDEFTAVRRRVDPDGVLSSDLARRLDFDDQETP